MAESNWLLDTSILVDLLRGNKPASDWIDSIPSDARFISVVTAAELLAGCHNKREQQTLTRELELYQIVWIDEMASEQALLLYRTFHLTHGVGFFDCLIAATAVARKLSLATLNLKHFAQFSGLDAKRPY